MSVKESDSDVIEVRNYCGCWHYDSACNNLKKDVIMINVKRDASVLR